MSSDKYEGEPDVGAPAHKDVESSRPAENVEYNLANSHDQLERGLKSRHIQFLALGEFYLSSVRYERPLRGRTLRRGGGNVYQLE